MTLEEAFRSIRFRSIQPHTNIQQFLGLIRILQLQPFFDRWNTVVPFLSSERWTLLQSLSFMPKMSTFAVGAIVNECVRRMPNDTCYLNIGTWRGYSLFAGMVGNRDARCIGVDSFVQFGGPRTAFLRDFQKLCSAHHSFFDMDWYDYMHSHHTEKIGVLFYDGAHDEKSQFDAMIEADPFIIENGIIIVDDTNWSGPKDAVAHFLQEKKNYHCIFEHETTSNCHPTFWNGIMVLQKKSA